MTASARQPSTYVIRIAGRLPASRESWFEGLSISHRSDGTTELVGSIVDQAQLHGLLAKVRDLNVTLLSVTQRSQPIHRNSMHDGDHERP